MCIHHLVLAVAVALWSADALHAQERRTLGRWAVGVAWEHAIFGDDNPKSLRTVAPTLGAQAWHPLSDGSAAVFDVTFQPNALRNPHFDESVRILYLLAGIEIGQRWYVRPAAGVGVGLLSGPRAEGTFGIGPAIGVAIGHRNVVGRKYVIAPEFFFRGGYTIGFATWLTGVQLVIGPQP